MQKLLYPGSVPKLTHFAMNGVALCTRLIPKEKSEDHLAPTCTLLVKEQLRAHS